MLSDLAKRCVDLSYRFKLTHVSSVLNTVDLIAEIYAKMQPGDVFVLGAGHASLAHFVVLESLGKCDAEEMIKRHGVHSSRDPEHGIIVSNGSLGQSETIALGLAMANTKRNVWLVTSDGSCCEGSVHEMARIWLPHHWRYGNLKIYVVCNGLSAYGRRQMYELPQPFLEHATIRTGNPELPAWLSCQDGHYLQLTEENHQELMT